MSRKPKENPTVGKDFKSVVEGIHRGDFNVNDRHLTTIVRETTSFDDAGKERDWQYVTLDDALALMKETVEKCGPRDAEMNLSSMGGVISVERGWGLSCSIDIKFDNMLRMKSTLSNEFGEFIPIQIGFNVGWGSTGRTLAGAQAAVRLYQEMVDLAMLLQSRMESCGSIGWWMVPDAEETQIS